MIGFGVAVVLALLVIRSVVKSPFALFFVGSACIGRAFLLVLTTPQKGRPAEVDRENEKKESRFRRSRKP
jgi:hypothetical protein